jgi:uncharacterized cupredoxin-like copper-binding protein
MLGTRRFATVLVIGAAFVVPITGCGGDDDDNGEEAGEVATEATASEPAGGGQTVNMSLADFRLDPAAPTVNAGTVTFKVINDGQTTHALEVEGPGEEAETEELAPGDSAELTVDLGEPGTYEMYCPVDGHKDQGMEGEITVQ